MRVSRRWLPKGAALALAFLLSGGGALARFGGIEGAGAQIAFLCLFALCWTAVFCAAEVRPGWLRWILATLFAGGAFYVDTFARASGTYLTYDGHINLLGSAGFIDDALAQNGRAFAGATVPALALLVGIGLAPFRRHRPGAATLVLACPVVVTLAITALLFVRGGDGAKGLPPSYTAFSYVLLERYERLRGGLGAREAVAIARASAPLYRKIVLVVDESVAGNYLDTGGFPGAVPTPLSREWPGVTIDNFGIAASITNCSVGTNETLRFGGTREAYLRQIAKAPSLWSYARGAGMRTVYIDAQRTGGALQNGMDDAERREIDSFVQFERTPVRDRDMAAERRLRAELADPRPAFIIVNKMGAHFPVHDKFPDGFARSRPILPRGGYTTIADTGSRAGFGGSPEDWRRYRNSYRNTLSWNVGEFFNRLLSSGELARTLLIYTSDHGQDLHEDGQPGTTTHCQPDPAAQEGAVPLVAIQGVDGALTFRPGEPTSHYRIAPTLLAAMGYERATVRAQYGPALDEGYADPATFNTRFNARLGRTAHWQKVDPAELPRPPDDN